LAYLLRPEPGPVGVSVEPLGEAPAPMVVPDGFMVFGPVGVERAEPVALPVVVPLTDEPAGAVVVVPLVAAPPEAEPAPAEPPLLCASANVLDSASAVASAIVETFMAAFLSAMSMNKSRRGFMFPLKHMEKAAVREHGVWATGPVPAISDARKMKRIADAIAPDP
jgi:hypothetical protein